MSRTNKQWLLARRPQGAVQPADFELAERPVPALAEGQLLVRHQFLSLDPYMRGRMEEAKSYAEPQKLGEPMIGGTVGEVVESRNSSFPVGSLVVGMGGWQEYSISDGRGLLPAPRGVPPSVCLGAAGMPGVTAWYGLTQIGKPRQGETVVVSAAAGAVGSVVGQLARLRGCRAVGIAGGPEKCRHVVEELGFDACLDYRAADFRAALKAALPGGADVLFENVGGAVLDAVLARMNPFGRVALCGLISGYDGQDIAIRNVRPLLTSRILLQGFIVSDHLAAWPEALRELTGLVAGGKLRYRETVAQGLESAPRAFIGLLKGENLGKQLVKL